MAQLPQKKEFVNFEKIQEDAKMEEEKKGEDRYDSYGKKLAAAEEKKEEEEGPRLDSYGKVLKPVENKKEKKQVVMPGSKNDVKKIYDFAEEEEEGKFVKHESFD
jgi:hypothetical protein